ncbi:hypothetical protein [Bosea sp. (in: a-proteobacteria)]|uniref:hypothetical protein n=1 Tax=Bosea sp. (in: a-proteobacteria) TaxID=1871050 RepID=UPI00260E1BB2|nr:hypothetical protein [Bosea sp. (in: a-proteobacteria)]MCO5091975.1 hypothetical protein [Bosea sp. (in: a-proteobacteria)]
MACNCIRCEFLRVIAKRYPGGVGPVEAADVLEATADISGIMLSAAGDRSMQAFHSLVETRRGIARDDLSGRGQVKH